ncbi:hypothetical protein [Methylobacterium tarhaniae]|uniref:hypothetical protein n=1 Tax=Methylobacterium tarhaniae TaxID=1187852 RepID=UPI003D009A96
MTIQPSHAIMPYLLLAEIAAALFGGPAASAEKRITLEVIGAVPMAGAGEIRRVDGAPGRAEAGQPRETTGERTDTGSLAHRN